MSEPLTCIRETELPLTMGKTYQADFKDCSGGGWAICDDTGRVLCFSDTSRLFDRSLPRKGPSSPGVTLDYNYPF